MARRSLHSSVPTVIGLDLSTRAAAACAIPRDWDQSVGSVRTMVVGYGVSDDAPEEERIRRLDTISMKIVDFCVKNKAMAVGIEEYAFAQTQSRAHALGEVGGCVKLELYRTMRIAAQPVIASSARKLLLQQLPSPRGKPKGFLKEFVVYNIKRLKGQTLRWTHDECDAFVVANARLDQVGGLAISYEGEF